ncbi:ATP-grasp domain-containing protein [Streptomyces noursei]|uniref:ATP-grasp domain-containing protein n=1 Tax=Streptomyces noursei TaxID=1971 RepID=UPI0033F31C49
MLPADRCAELAAALAARDCHLLTSPAAYRTAHELPGWYGTFEPLTPAGAWLPCAPGRPPEPTAPARLAASLGGPDGPRPVAVKDWVTSRKHEWAEAAYVPDAADPARLAAVVGRFVAWPRRTRTGTPDRPRALPIGTRETLALPAAALLDSGDDRILP